jgi:hypothetical protein
MRSIVEVLRREEFRPKNEGGRGAEGRLANHRLQPLGHPHRGEKAKYKRDRDLRARRLSPRLSLKLSLPARWPPAFSLRPALLPTAVERNGSFLNEPSAELPHSMTVSLLSQCPLFRRAPPTSTAQSTVAWPRTTSLVHRFSEPLRCL